jgi:septum formation inhibitor MinC
MYLDPQKPGMYVYDNDVFNYEPFYIGKGCANRKYVHIKYGNKYNNHLNRKIRKIKKTINSNPIIITYKEMLSEREALFIEKQLIKNIGRSDLKLGPLCNLTDGGDGISNISNETRNKMVISAKNMSYEKRQKINITHKGRKFSLEARNNMSVSKQGHFVSQSTKNKLKEAWKNMTNEHKEKMTGHKGIKHSDQTKKKISESKKGQIPWNKGLSKKYSLKDDGRI